MLLDLRGRIPANIHITDGKWHDSNELDELTPEPFAFYVMDKAYVDFKALFRFHRVEAWWVSRPKENMRFKTLAQLQIPEDAKVLLKIHGLKSLGINPTSYIWRI